MLTELHAGLSSLPAARRLRAFALFTAPLLPLAIACHHSSQPAESPYSAVPEISLSSSSFSGAQIPHSLSCDGAGTSPELAWTAPPSGAQSFVLIVTDPDAPMGTFVHWVFYDIPANKRELSAGTPNQDQLPDGSRQGRNSDNKIGYTSPCPPTGTTHRYFFDLFALDTRLNLPAGATRAQVLDAMNTHVIARGKLLARFGR